MTSPVSRPTKWFFRRPMGKVQPSGPAALTRLCRRAHGKSRHKVSRRTAAGWRLGPFSVRLTTQRVPRRPFAFSSASAPT